MLRSWVFIDANRTRRMLVLMAALWLLSLADLVFTIWAHLFTPLCEVNPIANSFLQHQDLGGLIIFKAATNILGCWLLWRTRENARAEVALWGVLGVFVLLIFRWSAYTSVALAMG